VEKELAEIGKMWKGAKREAAAAAACFPTVAVT
jgi:hypothetical protein